MMKAMKIVLGTMTFGESVFAPEVSEFLRIYRDAGGTELDTAYVYNEGRSELLLGEALAGMEQSFKIATKVNPRISGRLDGAAAYKQVSDTRDRVNLILSYTDRQRSPLELLLQVADALPEGATLTALTYKRTEGIKVSAESDQATMAYDFKDAITANPLFGKVDLTGPSISKGRNKFDVNAVFKGSVQKK